MTNPALGEFAPIVHDLVGIPAPELLSGDAAQPVPGSYLLLLEIAEPQTITIRKRDWRLPAGLFVYAGSAHGAGGLKARLTRHFRKEKKQHWHIDQVTMAARAMRALCFQENTECELSERLLASGRFSAPVPGFGSSDCKSCPTHFLEFSGG
ncbi:GIY-YIG nuclease family protein [Nisaea denitrificans]|uniref:GIY-YIG nuclease family protein n=1 Tax=Nisaea denitrificans TaxID=390877 RepID=UPI000411091B|nr:GIY-YIG nuclease family protein [Nisaea denitrificans]